MPRAAIAGLLLGVALAWPAVAAEPGLLITVGEVTDTVAVLWVRGVAWGPVAVRYRPLPSPVDPETTATSTAAATPQDPPPETQAEIRVSPSRNLTGKLALQPLQPATRYRYTVSQNNDEVTGEFVTAPSPTVSAPVRFTWSSDLGGRGYCRAGPDGYPIFRTMARRPVDFFLFVGDTIYADQVCGDGPHLGGYDFVARRPADFWAKHRYNREDPAVQAYFRGTSVYAIWDDHEVRDDFSGPGEPLMDAGRQAFLDYFPIRPPREEPGRLYRRFRWGARLELFILDTRQYRSPNTAPDGPAKTMLGAPQKRWLLDAVGASTATWKVVISSVPLSVPTGGRGNHDSWSNANLLGVPEERGTGFAVERDAILRTLRQRGVKNLVFITADVRHAEIIQHRPTPEWSFYELIAGPLSAALGKPQPLDAALNPRSLWSLGGVPNYGEITIDDTGMVVRVLDGAGQVRFTQNASAAAE